MTLKDRISRLLTSAKVGFAVARELFSVSGEEHYEGTNINLEHRLEVPEPPPNSAQRAQSTPEKTEINELPPQLVALTAQQDFMHKLPMMSRLTWKDNPQYPNVFAVYGRFPMSDICDQEGADREDCIRWALTNAAEKLEHVEGVWQKWYESYSFIANDQSFAYAVVWKRVVLPRPIEIPDHIGISMPKHGDDLDFSPDFEAPMDFDEDEPS